MNLNEVYHDNYHIVYNYLKKVVWKNVDEINIDEIINKSFFEFYNKKDKKYNTSDDAKYICKIAYNIMRNSYTYKMRFYKKNTTLEEYHHDYNSKEDILTMLIKEEQKYIIKKAIESLENKEKSIIVLYYFYGFNLKEISLITNIKYYNIGKNHKIALSKLRSYLNSIDYTFF